MEDRKDYIYTLVSLNSVINSTSTNKLTNPIYLEIPNGLKYKNCEFDEGFIVIRIPQTLQIPQLPTSFQIIVNQGNLKYFGDNVTTTNVVGVFLIDSTTQLALAGNNDLFSYSYKLNGRIKLDNVNNNLQLGIVGRVIGSTPGVNELFSTDVYRNGLYFVNFDWNVTNAYFALYLKLKFW